MQEVVTARPIITWMTDFGAGSPYVAAMKGVALSINPQLTLVDITHTIPPQDVRTAALTWPAVIERFPAGTVHVAVVDPGVGSQRKILYACYGGQHLICPDNGLITWLTRNQQHALTDVRTLADRRFWLPQISATFHGRDIMTPAAAHLTNGIAPAQLGPPLASPMLLDVPEVHVEENQATGSIATVDSFGNLITDIHQSQLPKGVIGEHVRVTCPPHEVTGICYTYQNQQPGRPIALYGSSGWLEIAVVNGNAAETLNLAPGAKVTVAWD